MTEKALPLSLEDTTAWMEKEGWRNVSEGSAGWLWENDEFNQSIGVLRNFNSDGDARKSLVSRLAHYHNIKQKDLENIIAGWRTDITLLRVANDSVINESIPLTAGAAMVDNARQMYRSAASTAVRLRANIGGNYSTTGDHVLDKVRLGHTRRGSYIVPIHIPVGMPDILNEMTIPGAEIQHLATQVESAERRTSRTFAQAMNSIDKVVIKPDRSPGTDDIDNLVAHGVSREFVSAMTRIVGQQAVAQLDASFQWAGAQQTPASVPKKVEIPSEAVPLLEDLAHTLRSMKRPRYETYTGPVVVVAREPEDSETRFSIRTLSNGRASLVESSTSEPLSEVTRWMNERTIVQLRGDVSRTSSGIVMNKSDIALFDKMDF